MAKMLFDLQRGVIEIDGEEKFVEKVYGDIRDTMLGKLGSLSAQPTQTDTASKTDTAAREDPPKVRRKPRATGPSCPSRIEALKEENFFKDLKTAKEIGARLREKGTAYEGKRIASALLNLTSAGKLRRLQEGGVWKYQNP